MKPSFFDFSNKDTAYDEFSADDIRGSLMTVVSTVASAFEGETWRKGVFRR